MEEFKYTPQDIFKNTTAYPNPANATQTREQFSRPLEQIRDYLNRIITKQGNDVVILRVGANKELQYSLDGSNWVSFPLFDFEVVKEVE